MSCGCRAKGPEMATERLTYLERAETMAAALIVQGLWTLSVFMWSRSANSGARLQRNENEIKALREEFTSLEQTLERARKRSSEQEGRNNATFGTFQIEQAVQREKIAGLERDHGEIWTVLRKRRTSRDD